MTASARRLWMVAGAVLGSLAAGCADAAETFPAPVDGRALYHGFKPFSVGLDATTYRMPPQFAACARCHGAAGEGSREGVVVAPSLAWAALSGRRGGLPPFATDDHVLRAVTLGIGRDGGKLAAAMPRYRLSAQEAGALLAYIKRIGGPDDNPPGVTPTSVRLATLLPLSGPGASAGSLVRTALEDIFAEVNRKGGIHGRVIDFAVADINAAADAPVAPAAVIASAPFAVVGGMWRSTDATTDGTLARQRIGKVATLISRRAASDLDVWDADLLPPLDVQHAALVTALQACPDDGIRLGIPIIANDAERDAATPIRWFDDVAELMAARNASARGCYGLGLATFTSLRGMDDSAWEQFTCAKGVGTNPRARPAGNAIVKECDPTKPVPLKPGDYVTYNGMLQADAGGFLIAAHGLAADLGIYTSPGVDPAYLFIEEAIQGTKGEIFASVPPSPQGGSIPQEETTRFRVVGFTTDPSRNVEISIVDSDRIKPDYQSKSPDELKAPPYAPFLTSFTGLAGLTPSNGPQLGRFRNTWPSKDDARAVRRDVWARIVGPRLSPFAKSGQYVAPINEYIYPEATEFGTPGFPLPVPSENFCFLSKGGGKASSGPATIDLLRLDPFPNSGHALSQPIGAGSERACDNK